MLLPAVTPLIQSAAVVPASARTTVFSLLKGNEGAKKPLHPSIHAPSRPEVFENPRQYWSFVVFSCVVKALKIALLDRAFLLQMYSREKLNAYSFETSRSKYDDIGIETKSAQPSRTRGRGGGAANAAGFVAIAQRCGAKAVRKSLARKCRPRERAGREAHAHEKNSERSKCGPRRSSCECFKLTRRHSCL